MTGTIMVPVSADGTVEPKFLSLMRTDARRALGAVSVLERDGRASPALAAAAARLVALLSITEPTAWDVASLSRAYTEVTELLKLEGEKR